MATTVYIHLISHIPGKAGPLLLPRTLAPPGLPFSPHLPSGSISERLLAAQKVARPVGSSVPHVFASSRLPQTVLAALFLRLAADKVTRCVPLLHSIVASRRWPACNALKAEHHNVPSGSPNASTSRNSCSPTFC
eukprot:TRINITY_DN19148_c1_g2_i3.p2 TRINITY_DN19148_c1_g2~~TRINITY_DN19148_c1_g2_i3.p2  ORF type:complete len:135 (-),score=6.91 TRINITY_DN19148_c1_g2_i3:438-842(-)